MVGLELEFSATLSLSVISLAGCGTNQRAGAESDIDGSAFASDEEVDFENRNQFESYAELRFDRLSGKFEEAKDMVNASTEASVDADVIAKVQAGETQRAELQIQLREFTNAFIDGWKDLKSDLESDLDDFEDTIVDIQGSVNSSTDMKFDTKSELKTESMVNVGQ